MNVLYMPKLWCHHKDRIAVSVFAMGHAQLLVIILTFIPAVALLLQYSHPAWEGFDISKLHAEYEKLEAEKQAYLAAKATAGGKQ